jgi:hypothetical protein
MAIIKEKSMKSIKEKAEEYHVKVRTINEHVSLVDTQGSEMFIAGANYVLDVIADVVNQPMNDYLVLEELKKVILQLKK